MGVNKIILKIQEDASLEKADIIAAAEKKAEVATKRIIEDAKKRIVDIEEQAKADAEEAVRRQTLIAELESRRKALDSKRDVIAKAFESAEKELENLPQETWERLITNIVLKCSETGEEKLCVPAKDLDKYKNGMLDKLNKELVENGKKGELTLFEEPAKFNGGVLLIGKNSDFDGSFEMILKEIKTKSERNVAEILFGSEVE